ncbi:MAG: hypothetical protein HY040_04280 [Planctomycetes bacterium]|nr:hypothetical protein [Planctomycetota bacterium]
MADTPVITCPECTKKFKGKGDLSGKRIRCPLCSHVFVVPAQSKAHAAEQPRRTFLDDDDADKNPYGVTELDLSARCPNCANPMADEKAFVCLYCGYNTLTRELGKTEKSVAHTGGEHFKHLLPGLFAVSGILFIIMLLLFYSLVLPSLLSKESWISFLDHESMRLWLTTPLLSAIWALGYFAFRRLIIKPLPPPKLTG